MSHDFAQYVGDMLSKYYSAFIPMKKVVKELDVNGTIQAFDLPCEVGDHFLNEYTPSKDQDDPLTVELLLKDETDANLLDLGMQRLLFPYDFTYAYRCYTFPGKYVINVCCCIILVSQI